MNFEFATAQRIIFGTGTLNQLPDLAQPLGSKPVLVTGTDAQRVMPVFRLLKDTGCKPAAFSVKGEPTTEHIERLAARARELGCDCVVAYGGGSVIDAGKAIAALLTNTDELMNYLEVIGKGKPLTETPAPCIAIPTTAGTGAEVTRNAVLLSPERKVKVSMRHPLMLPDIALIDPELTRSMPPAVTASTGLDAFVQLLEAFVSVKSNPLTDALCREGLAKAAHALPIAYRDGNNMEAREAMALASLFGGLALANAGLGAVHGFAGPVGGMFSVPHGTLCAALLPATVEANLKALKERTPDSPAIAKYEEAFAICMQEKGDALQWLRALCAELGAPRLGALGIHESDFAPIVEKSKHASSMKGNPIQLTDEELMQILSASL